MSIETMSWVLNHSSAVGTDKVILLGIASHADAAGRNAWPSIDTLARYANVSPRSVQRAIQRMVEDGDLTVDEQAGGTKNTRSDRRPNLYTVVIERGDVPDTSGSNGVTPTTPRGDAHDANGVTPTSPELSLELSLNRPTPLTPHGVGIVSAPPPNEKTRAEGCLAEVWANYPPSRRIAKSKCETTVARILQAGTPPDAVIDGIRRWSAYWRAAGTEEQFIPHSTTWLNQQRWESPPPTLITASRPKLGMASQSLMNVLARARVDGHPSAIEVGR